MHAMAHDVDLVSILRLAGWLHCNTCKPDLQMTALWRMDIDACCCALGPRETGKQTVMTGATSCRACTVMVHEGAVATSLLS